MKKFRKIWNDETNGFLTEHKGLNRMEVYEAFMVRFPDSRVTFCALCNQLSRLGLRQCRPHGTRRPRPLWSEQVKKGYVRIKIAEPNVWVSKAKWVYMETHPWEDFSERSNYVFLDGDNRNFSPENIERVPIKFMGLFNIAGGCEKGNPELTKLRILQVKMKLAIYDAGENLGLVVRTGNNTRLFREERNRKARERNSSPERRKIIAERARKYRERIKRENPERYAEIRQRQMVYHKEWYRRKRMKGHEEKN